MAALSAKRIGSATLARIEAHSTKQPMARAKEFRDALGGAIFTPKISEKASGKTRRDQTDAAGPGDLGARQSPGGQERLIRALTGRDDAAIGNGFQPCTRTARLYDFPDTTHCFVRFLDTRGLGEIDYDPTEDMRLFGQQAHLLMVVMRAMDHSQQRFTGPAGDFEGTPGVAGDRGSDHSA